MAECKVLAKITSPTDTENINKVVDALLFINKAWKRVSANIDRNNGDINKVISGILDNKGIFFPVKGEEYSKEDTDSNNVHLQAMVSTLEELKARNQLTNIPEDRINDLIELFKPTISQDTTTNQQEDLEVTTQQIQEAIANQIEELLITNNDLINLVYQGNRGHNRIRLFDFTKSVLTSVFVQNGSYKLNSNEYSINSNIARLKNQWMHQICQYFNMSEQDFYTKSGKNWVYNDKVEDILNMFKHELYTQHIKDDISSNPAYRQAVNAFFNIINFDQDLKEVLGTNLKKVRSVEHTFSSKTYPYVLSNSSSLRKSWSDNELINGLTNISQMSKSLFKIIPYIDKNGNPVDQFIDDISAITTVSHLLDELKHTSIQSLAGLRNRVQTIRLNPEKLLYDIFNNPNITQITSTFNDKEQDILNSIKQWGFSKNGLYVKQLQGGNDSKATVLDCIVTSIVALDPMNYQQSIILDEGKEVICDVRVKDKFNYNREALNTAEVINNELDKAIHWNRSLVITDNYGYKIPYNGIQNSFQIRYGNLLIVVSPKKGRYNANGVLARDASKIDIQIYNNYTGQNITNDYINGDFNNRAIQNGAILPKYQTMFDFIEKSLVLDTVSKDQLLKQYSQMQKMFGQGTYNGFTGMLVTAIHTEIAKHLQGLYKASNFTGSIVDFYDQPLLKEAYKGINLLSDRGSIARSGELGIEFIPASTYSDDWLMKFGQTRKIVDGTNISAVTSNASGDKIPNYRQYSIGTNITELLREQVNSMNEYRGQETRTAASSQLLFVQNLIEGTNLLDESRLDLEAVSAEKRAKALKSMTSAELIYHGVFDNFFAHLFDKTNPFITVKPGTYSDKTSDYVYPIRANININRIATPLTQINSQQVKDAYKQTVGEYYRRILNNVLYDWTSAVDQTKYPSFPLTIGADNSKAGDKLSIGYNMSMDELLNASKILDRWTQQVPTHKSIRLSNGKQVSTSTIYKDYVEAADKNIPYDISYQTDSEGNVLLDNSGNPVIKSSRTLQEVYDSLEKGVTIQQLSSMAQSRGAAIYSNITYRGVKGKARLNPVLVFLGSQQFKMDDTGNTTLFDRRWELEKIYFINSLLKKQFKVQLTQTIQRGGPDDDLDPFIKSMPALQSFNKFFSYDEKSKIDLRSWREYQDKEGNTKLWRAQDWQISDYMVIAKVQHADGSIDNILFEPELQLSKDDKLIINPMLDYFFNVDNLLSNNLRLTMLGTELADPIKYKGFKANMQKHLESLSARSAESDDPTISEQLDSMINLSKSITDNDIIQNMEYLANNNQSLFHEMEANLWGTSNKRANIVTATMLPMSIGTEQGVQARVNIATIEDLPASVWNFKGQADKDIDSMDGSTYINPIQAVWESWSLGGQTIGMDKKTIGHAYDNRTGSVSLLKHATYAITNERMRMASNSDIRLLDMFKRMSSIKFGNQPVNLVPQEGISFDNLYYESGPNIFSKILSLRFNPDNNLYYTLEKDVTIDADGNVVEDSVTAPHIVYQVFDSTTQERLTPEEYNNRNGENVETINTVYELHRALGGIYSKELTEDGLVDSEASNIECARVLNNARIVQYDENNNIVKIDQPYKDKLIHYLANKSASKRAQGNVNTVKAWTDSSISLNYVPMTLLHYGVQLDADHEKDDGEITQPTQAMTALEQGGNLHSYSKRVYRTLGQLAAETCKLELDTANEFLVAYNNGKELSNSQIDNLFESIGSIVSQSYSQQSDAELGDIILQGVARVLKSPKEEIKQKLKIPLSDATLFNSLLPSIASVINNKGIKGKYKGLALVLTPGYKYVQTFKYGGETHMAEDVYQDAIKLMNSGVDLQSYLIGEPLSNDYQIRKSQMIKAFLLYSQEQEELAHPDGISVEEFVPSDIVNIMYDVNGQKFRAHISLDNIDTYYEFIEAAQNGTLKDYLYNKKILTDKRSKNIKLCQDIIHPRDLAPERVSFDYTDSQGNTHHSNIFLIDGIRNNRNNPQLRKSEYQQIMNDLHNGKAVINGEEVQITNLTLDAAENVMPNIYDKQFGTAHKTLLQAKEYLNNKITDASTIKPSIFTGMYTIAFTNNNNKHTYINLSEGFKNDKGLRYNFIDESRYTTIKEEDGIQWIYKTTRDKQLLYKIGVRQPGGGDFYFVEHYKAIQPNGNKQSLKFDYYYINKEALSNILSGALDKNRVPEYIGNIIKDIYNQNSYLGAEISETERAREADNYDIITNIFQDNNLKQFIENQYSLSGVLLDDTRQEYYSKQQQYLLSSFEKALDNMADRIPTASLQSFMKMKTVGFTQINTNRIYVSHFQAWLQGSDYDIDKAYVMGFNFDDNGKLIGWSDLFDYSTKETLDSSCSLPTPRNSKWAKSLNGINLDEFAQKAHEVYDNGLDVVKRNDLINEIFDKIDFDSNEVVNVTYSDSVLDNLISDINIHEATVLQGDQKIKAYQNSVSWSVQYIVNDVRNLLDSYAPTSVSGMSKAVSDLNLSSDSNTYTMWNPSTKWILQEENLIGKNVISVAANAEKVYFSLLHYYNEVVRHPEKYDSNLYKFVKTYKGIFTDDNGNPIDTITKSTIGGINFDNNPDLKNLSILLLSSNDSVRQLMQNAYTLYSNDLEEGKVLFEQDFIKAYKTGVISNNLRQVLNSINSTIEQNRDYYYILQNIINNDTDPADLISQLLNSATDNAKELILAKINAGMNLAGVHGYLMIMGFSLNQITRLMTSPVVKLVDQLSKDNMFIQNYSYSNSVKSVLDFLINPSNQVDWSRYIYNPILINKYSTKMEDTVGRYLLNLINNYNLESYNNKGEYLALEHGAFVLHSKNDVKVYNTIDAVSDEQLRTNMKNLIKETYDNEIFNKLVEFKKIHRGARETTAAAQLIFSMNQGIRTQQNEQLAFENRVNSFVQGFDQDLPPIEDLQKLAETYKGRLLPSNLSTQDSKESLAIKELFKPIFDLHPEYSEEYVYNTVYQAMKAGIYKDFSFYKYMLNPNITVDDIYGNTIDTDYRTLAAEYYNLIKDAINIFDVINHSEQYSKYLELMKSATVLTDSASTKSTLVRNFYEILRKERKFLDSKLIKQIQSYIDQAYIQQYLTNLVLTNKDGKFQFKFPLQAGDTKLIEQIPTVITANEDVQLADRDSIATFKYWMHNTLIPNLKNGKYWDGTKVVTDQNLANNEFIRGLVVRKEFGVPVESLDIDMLNIDKSRESVIRYSAYEQGFNKLGTYKIGNITLQDLFMLYNLYVNNNRYGYNRLTTLFQGKLLEDINNLENPEYIPSVLMQWYQFIGDSDKKNISQTIANKNLSPEDKVQFLGISVTGFNYFTAPIVDNFRQARGIPIVRMKDSNPKSPTYGLMVLYDTHKKTIINQLNEISNTNSTAREQQDRLRINKQYYPININSKEQFNRYKKLLETQGNTLLYDMTVAGKLKIKVDC